MVLNQGDESSKTVLALCLMIHQGMKSDESSLALFLVSASLCLEYDKKLLKTIAFF